MVKAELGTKAIAKMISCPESHVHDRARNPLFAKLRAQKDTGNMPDSQKSIDFRDFFPRKSIDFRAFQSDYESEKSPSKPSDWTFRFLPLLPSWPENDILRAEPRDGLHPPIVALPMWRMAIILHKAYYLVQFILGELLQNRRCHVNYTLKIAL